MVKARYMTCIIQSECFIWTKHSYDTLKFSYDISSYSRCYKTLLRGKLDFPKIKKLKNSFLLPEPSQKCSNTAISKDNYNLTLLIAFKMAHSCCFTLGDNLDFIQKNYNIDYWSLWWMRTPTYALFAATDVKRIQFRFNLSST